MVLAQPLSPAAHGSAGQRNRPAALGGVALAGRAAPLGPPGPAGHRGARGAPLCVEHHRRRARAVLLGRRQEHVGELEGLLLRRVRPPGARSRSTSWPARSCRRLCPRGSSASTPGRWPSRRSSRASSRSWPCTGRSAAGPGVTPGLLAAAIFALTPIAASMFGHSMEDGALTMCLVLAADAYQRAVTEGGSGRCIWAGVWVGLGFQAKMLQAWMVLPALAVGYLVAAPAPLRRRLATSARRRWSCSRCRCPGSRSTRSPRPRDRPYVDGSTNQQRDRDGLRLQRRGALRRLVRGRGLVRPGCHQSGRNRTGGAAGGERPTVTCPAVERDRGPRDRHRQAPERAPRGAPGRRHRVPARPAPGGGAGPDRGPGGYRAGRHRPPFTGSPGGARLAAAARSGPAGPSCSAAVRHADRLALPPCGTRPDLRRGSGPAGTKRRRAGPRRIRACGVPGWPRSA